MGSVTRLGAPTLTAGGRGTASLWMMRSGPKQSMAHFSRIHAAAEATPPQRGAAQGENWQIESRSQKAWYSERLSRLPTTHSYVMTPLCGPAVRCKRPWRGTGPTTSNCHRASDSSPPPSGTLASSLGRSPLLGLCERALPCATRSRDSTSRRLLSPRPPTCLALRRPKSGPTKCQVA